MTRDEDADVFFCYLVKAEEKAAEKKSKKKTAVIVFALKRLQKSYFENHLKENSKRKYKPQYVERNIP